MGDKIAIAKKFGMGLLPGSNKPVFELTLTNGSKVRYSPTWADIAGMVMGVLNLASEASAKGVPDADLESFSPDLAGPIRDLAVCTSADDPDPILVVLAGPQMLGLRCSIEALEGFASQLPETIARLRQRPKTSPPQRH